VQTLHSKSAEVVKAHLLGQICYSQPGQVIRLTALIGVALIGVALIGVVLIGVAPIGVALIEEEGLFEEETLKNLHPSVIGQEE
jgi:hypothetical protein